MICKDVFHSSYTQETVLLPAIQSLQWSTVAKLD